MAFCVDLVICGYGRMGRATARSLSRQGKRLLVVDRDPDQVALARGDGHAVIQGDATRPRMLQELKRLGVSNVIVCVGDNHGVQLVKLMRGVLPHSCIQAASKSRHLADEYTMAGACNVVVEPWVAGQALASSVLN